MIRILLIALISAGVSESALAFNRPERLLLATQEWFPYQYQEKGEMKVGYRQSEMRDAGNGPTLPAHHDQMGSRTAYDRGGFSTRVFPRVS